MNTQLTKFFSGLTKADISNKFYNTTSNAYIEEAIFEEEEVCPYIEALNTHINTRVEEIDSEYNYRMYRIHTTTNDDVLLTPWVKGGRI